MEHDDAAPDRQRYLAIYLQDHRAGAEAGVRVAERCRDHAPDADTAAELSELVTEIDQDRRTLATIMAGLGIDPSTVKQLAAKAAERLGRLKFNGHAVRSSPLRVLVELEGLVGAVSVKRELWATLRTLAVGPSGRNAELEGLIARADDQQARFQAIHSRIARRLFDSADGATRAGSAASGGSPAAAGDGNG
jgi:hypothetical protein